jgi:hypothetical protein
VAELSGEVNNLKSELASVGSDMKGVTDTITELTNKLLTAELGTKTTRSELTSLRSGLAGLTTSLLATKSQTDLIVEVRQSDMGATLTRGRMTEQKYFLKENMYTGRSFCRGGHEQGEKDGLIILSITPPPANKELFRGSPLYFHPLS